MRDLPLDAEGLEALTDLEDVLAVAPILEALTDEVDILLFIAPGCQVCPHQVRAAATVALANPLVHLEMVDATQDPALARRHAIGSVPTTIIDGDVVLVGVTPVPELAHTLVKWQGPGAETVVLASLVEAGRHADAGQRLADGLAADAFMELWERSTLESRMGLMLAVEEALDLNPDGLTALVPRLVAGLDGLGPLADDETRRGDTADLLGRIGNPDARPALERLCHDTNEQVAEAARAALDELAGGSPPTPSCSQTQLR
ncbi:MAG: thioredoxin family protein [Gemmatimonadota bacterium]|jgi:HEAT repeat protein